MTVLVEQVASELARPTPAPPVFGQWQGWIDRAYRLIETRLGAPAFAAVDIDVLDDVVLTAVAEHVRSWRDTTASRYTVTIDDGTVSRQYESASGMFAIPDALWVLLDPTLADSGAFSVSPFFEPDTVVLESWA